MGLYIISQILASYKCETSTLTSIKVLNEMFTRREVLCERVYGFYET
jgi:hypothetical protein